MENAVKPTEQHKSGDNSKKWNTSIGPTQNTPTAEPQANTTNTNKPNQGWRSTKRKNMRQNEARRQELPHFVRTEMEILKHLRRVNRDLRILLQPKYKSDPTPRVYKGNQPPSRQCREQYKHDQAAQSKANAVCKKSQNVLAKARNMKSKRQKTQQLKPTTNANSDAPLQTNKSCTRKTQVGVPAVRKLSSTATRRNTLQRLMLYFRPKRKLDACQIVQKSLIKDNKKSVANEALQSRTQNTLCGKIKRGLQVTRTRNGKVKAQHIKATETNVRDDEATMQKYKEEKVLKEKVLKEQVLKEKVKGRERILKQKVKREKSLKQQPTDEEAIKQKTKAQNAQKLKEPEVEAEAEVTNPCLKIDEPQTVREKIEKMLAPRMKRFRADTKLQNEDDSKSALMPNKKRYFLRKIEPTNAECAQQEQQAVRQIESTITNGKFGNCLHFFKALRKAQVPVVKTSELKTPSETVLKKVCSEKRKLRQTPTNIEHLPSSSHVNMNEYVEAIKAIRRHNRDIYKDPHETPSTSSLEEYFHVLSERMAREQKEADARKPRRHRGRRGTSNYNLQHRRARPPIK